MAICAVHSKRRRSMLTIAVAFAATPALAEDLVMPFACEVRGGQVSVVPAEERSYRILGPREHHVFSVCAPDDPNRCRNWMIHRFDVGCDGGRVSWLRVAEAALQYSRQKAWVEAGHMRLELDQRWGVGSREPYAARPWGDRAEADPDAPYGRGDQGPRAPSRDSVELPSGFAPTLGLPVTFADGVAGETHSFDAVSGPPIQPSAAEPRGRYVQTDRGEEPWRSPDASPPLAQPAESVPSGWSASPVPPPRKDVAPPRKEKPAVVAQAAPQPATHATPQLTPPLNGGAEKPQKAAALKPSAPPDSPSSSAAAPATSPAPAVPPGSVTPTLLNGAQSGAAAPSPAPSPSPQAVAEAPPKAPEPLKAEPPKPEPPAAAPAEKVETKAEQAPPAPPPAAASTKTIPDVGLSPAAAESSTPLSPAAVWAIGLGAVLLAASGAVVLLSRREDHGRAFAERDLSSVSLGTGRDLVPAPREMSLSVDTFASPALQVADDLPIPATIADALAVLGASSDAGPAVLKKIVDGLRQSWHPDLARSPEDRVYRERRLAQINVAWDILEARARPAA